MTPKKVTKIREKDFKVSTKQNLQTKQSKPRVESGSLYSYKEFGICWIAVDPPSRGKPVCKKGSMRFLHPKYFKFDMHFYACNRGQVVAVICKEQLLLYVTG